VKSARGENLQDVVGVAEVRLLLACGDHAGEDGHDGQEDGEVLHLVLEFCRGVVSRGLQDLLGCSGNFSMRLGSRVFMDILFKVLTLLVRQQY